MAIDYIPYGPQAPHISTLINRCAALTPQEAELLARAQDPTLRDKDEYTDIPKATIREAERLFHARGTASGAAWRATRATGRGTTGPSSRWIPDPPRTPVSGGEPGRLAGRWPVPCALRAGVRRVPPWCVRVRAGPARPAKWWHLTADPTNDVVVPVMAVA
jgi:hypothetical protein